MVFKYLKINNIAKRFVKGSILHFPLQTVTIVYVSSETKVNPILLKILL